MELVRLLKPYFEHSDARGGITGLVREGEWREVNLIESQGGATRGRHYHKHTKECFIILEGEIRVELMLRMDGKVERAEILVGSGDAFVVPPGVEHTFHILRSARWINLLSTPLDQDDPDFHRYADT